MDLLNDIETHEIEWNAKFKEINKDKETQSVISKNFWDILDKLNHSDLAKLYNNNIEEQQYIYCDGWYIYNKYNIIDFLGDKAPITLKHNITEVLHKLFKSEIDKIGVNDKNYKFCHGLYKNAYKSAGTDSFKNGIVEALKGEYLDDKLIDKIDANNNLLAFEKNLFDLTIKDFRPIEKNDFISFNCKFDINQRSNKIIRDELNELLFSIFEDKEIIQYWKESVGLSLFTNKFQSLYVHTGSGGNGKGLLFNLIQNATGSYFHTAGNTFLTSNFKSEVANPSLAMSKGKRIFCISEPPSTNSKNECNKLKVDFVKKLTGNDRMSARALFKNPIEFTPLFTCFIQCNEKPELDKIDDGIHRRLKIINYPFKFVKNPKKSNEKALNIQLGEKLKQKDYINEFMLILLKTVKKYNDTKDGISEPLSVSDNVNQYIRENDPAGEWILSSIITDHDKKIRTSLLHKYFMEDTETVIDSKKFISLLKKNDIEIKSISNINYALNVKYNKLESDDEEEEKEQKGHNLDL